MKKGIFLSIGALVLIGVIGFGIWYINETGKMRTENKDFFIPYNSAFVVTVNQKPVLPPEVEQAYGKEVERFRKRLLVQVTDSLRGQDMCLLIRMYWRHGWRARVTYLFYMYWIIRVSCRVERWRVI